MILQAFLTRAHDQAAPPEKNLCSTVLVCSMSRSCYTPSIRKSIKVLHYSEKKRETLAHVMTEREIFAYTLHVVPIKSHLDSFVAHFTSSEINLVSVAN